MTYAPKIQGDFALNQIVVHLAVVTRSIAGPGKQAYLYILQPFTGIGDVFICLTSCDV